MTLQIRPAAGPDVPAIANFAALTFREAFGAGNRPEDMALYLSANYSTEHQMRELTDPAWTTLLAEDNQTIAGFAQLCQGPCPPCVTSPDRLEVARFYVGVAWHGRGVAQRLMDAAIGAAAVRGARALWLGVWERNRRAIAFYGKCGFVDVGEKTFTVGTDLQHDRVMVLALPRES